MSEFCWARISIGGSIQEPLIQDLINLLNAKQLITDSSCTSIESPTIKDLLANLDENNILTLESNEASSGEYKEVERWLQDHDVPYIRMSDHGSEDGENIPARTVFWMPGMEKGSPKTMIDDTEGEHLIHIGELEWIISSIENIGSIKEAPKFLNHGTAHEQAYAAYILNQGKIDPIGYIKNYLKESYTVPTLPPFKVL